MSLQSPRHAGKRHGDRLVELVRYKTIIGEKLRARRPESQVAEAITAGNILNRLAGSLPIGERLRTIVADPGMLLADFVSGSEATASANQAAGLQTSFGVKACAGSGILASKIGPICDLIDSLPEFERVVGLVEFIEQLPNLSEMIDGIGTLLDPLFVSVNETTDTALTLFCNSGVGQRRIFNGLCGR